MFVILIIVAAIVIVFAVLYNRLIKLKNKRENAFADIDVQLKLRLDLVPQLVESVKGYMKHESTVLSDVTNARTNAVKATTVNDKIAADNQLSGALKGLQVAVEAYPDLKASQNFIQLQDQISDIENKLATARRFFNTSTKEFNNAVETFPSNFVADMFNFKREPMFDVGTEQRAKMDEAPKINF